MRSARNGAAASSLTRRCSPPLRHACARARTHTDCAWPNGVAPTPTVPPTNPPTKRPTAPPTRYPTKSPTGSPTKKPTASPTSPTNKPTRAPTTLSPTGKPTTPQPTAPPTTRTPTFNGVRTCYEHFTCPAFYEFLIEWTAENPGNPCPPTGCSQQWCCQPGERFETTVTFPANPSHNLTQSPHTFPRTSLVHFSSAACQM